MSGAGGAEARRVAAVAAVLSYLARRGGGGPAAAGALVPRPDGRGRDTGAGAAGPRLWALYGRQALMSQRTRMQARRSR